MSTSVNEGAIAVIGVGMRYPGGVNDEESFWELLCSQRRTHSAVPSSRFNARGHADGASQGGHFLENISGWDAAFFGIPAQEADATDPQQKLLLQVTYEALENAGIRMEDISGSQTGCWVGFSASDWRELLYKDCDACPLFAEISSHTASLSGRISWFFDLRGPSVSLNTACASSLTAVAAACDSLRLGAVDTALVGAVSLIVSPDTCTGLARQRFLSPDGLSKTFDARGDGFGRGEGVGVLVLRRLDVARRSGDPVRCVLAAYGVNHNGRTGGITEPRAEAQAQLIQRVYSINGLDPCQTGYVEAHGTGTAAGDPAELEAIELALGSVSGRKSRLLVGSVKPNIGHSEGAAGMASLIKSMISLEKGYIPPLAGLRNLTPRFAWEQSHLEVVEKLTPFPNTDECKRISVSSLGATGTNAHVVIERPPKAGIPHSESNGAHHHQTKLEHGATSRGRYRLFLFSAHSPDALKKYIVRFIVYLQQTVGCCESKGISSDNFLDSLAHTLAARRSMLNIRCCVPAISVDDLVTALQSKALNLGKSLHDQVPHGRSDRRKSRPTCKLIFIFTGQGAQWPRMGAQLLQFSKFKETVESADLYIRHKLHAKWSPMQELLCSQQETNMDDPAYSQTLCTVLQIALIDLLSSWNVQPATVVGHSSGEIAAAYSCGALDKETCLRLAYWRGVVSARLADGHGAMLAAAVSAHRGMEIVNGLSSRIPGSITVACENSPQNTTFAGDRSAIEAVRRELESDGIWCKTLSVKVAYHSQHMQRVTGEYLAAISDCLPLEQSQRCTMFSSLTSQAIEAEELGPSYWARNLISPVLFAPALRNALLRATENPASNEFLLEVGPHSALASAVRETLDDINRTNVGYASTLARAADDAAVLFTSMARLYESGVPVFINDANRDDLHSLTPPILSSLPRYAWTDEGQSKLPSRLLSAYLFREYGKGSLLGAPLPGSTSSITIWRSFLSLDDHPWLADHVIHGTIVVPAAVYLSMVMEAGYQLESRLPIVYSHCFQDLSFLTATLIEPNRRVECILAMQSNPGTNTRHFSISAMLEGDRSQREVCNGLWTIKQPLETDTLEAGRSCEVNLEAENFVKSCKASSATTVTTDEFYDVSSSLGYQFGKSFKQLKHICTGANTATATIKIGRETKIDLKHDSQQGPVIHPATLDAFFNIPVASLRYSCRHALVPETISRIEISNQLTQGMAEKEVELAARSEMTSTCSARAVIYGIDAESREEVIRIEGLNALAISSPANPALKITCSQYLWAADFSILSADQIAKALDTKQLRAVDECRNGEIASMIQYMAQSVRHASVLHIGEHAVEDLSLRIRTPADGVSRMHEYNWYALASEDVSTAEPLLASKALTWVVDTATLRPCWRTRTAASQSDTFDIVIVESLSMSSSSSESHHSMLADKIIRLVKQHWKASALLCLVGPSSMSTLQMSLSDALALQSTRRIHDVDASTASLVVMRQPPGSWRLNDTLSIPADPDTSRAAFALLLPAQEYSGQLTEDFANRLVEDLKHAGFDCSVNRLDSRRSLPVGCPIIALLELESSFFEQLTDEDLTVLRQMAAAMKIVHWVVALRPPLRALASGFAHSIRHEFPDMQFRTTHLHQLTLESVASSVQLLLPIFVGMPHDQEHWQDPETGLLVCPRVVPDRVMSSSVNIRLATLEGISSMKAQGSERLHLRVEKAGDFDSMCFVREGAGNAMPLASDEVQVRVKASGVNFKDVMIATGKIRRNALGGEGSGVVESLGEDVHELRVGDRVLFFATGAHSSTVRLPAAFCRRIPATMNFAEAASLPINHLTALYSLLENAHAESQGVQRRRILIHAAAGGVGQVMIQVAQHLRLDIFATVGSQDKRDLLVEKYGLRSEQILRSRDTTFGPALRRLTAGRGVDIIINSLTGDLARESWACLASRGMFVELGKAQQVYQQADDGRDVQFVAFDLENIARDCPQTISTHLDGMMKLFESGITRVVTPLRTCFAYEASKVFRSMVSGKHSGKTVLLWDMPTSVRCIREVLPQLPLLKLDSAVTYLLVGGLGGLGRSLAYHLARNGARHLCFLSRSGLSYSDHRAQRLVRDLRDQFNVSVKCYPCDVGDYEQLVSAVDRCTRNGPPIRGVIQGAMALHDTVLANMTSQQWKQSLRPKVAGTWNLHRLFADGALDFFILLSSFVTIIGNPGQANYSAACAFQDDLARHRHSLGLKCVSINLGIMKDVGVLADGHVAATTALREWGHFEGIREHEFLRLMTMTIDDQASNRCQLPAVLATGVPSAKQKVDGEMKFDATQWLSDTRFSLLDNSQGGSSLDESNRVGGASDPMRTSNRRKLANCTSVDEAQVVILHALVEKCHEWLQLPSGSLDDDLSLSDYGFNSLSAIETQNWLSRELGVKANMLELLSNKSIADLSRSFAMAVIHKQANGKRR